jgi:hypothetical protein
VIDSPSITCGRCRTTSTLEDWKGPVGAELTANRFQCPKCAWAFERRVAMRYGQHVIKCQSVDPELALVGGGR